MTNWDEGLLDEKQSNFVSRQLQTPVLVENMSWNLVDTRVLLVRAAGACFVVKAAPLTNHHIGREITAHETYTEPLVRLGRTGRLIARSRSINILMTTFQPGVLVQGSAFEWASDIYGQAGATLRALHDQNARVDDEYEFRMTDKAIAYLDQPHRIASHLELEARRILAAYKPAPIVVAPTHGDWQPRNWLADGQQLRVIDFGRFGFRPPATDFCRLASQQWRDDPSLEEAFLSGYDADPRDSDVWPIDLLREAIGTVVWAFQAGDVAFEEQGYRMLEEAIIRLAG